MKREEAVSLLKEIIRSCDSFRMAESVSITKNKETQGWMLKAKWLRHESEKDCLNNLMLKYGVEVAETDGYTIIRKPTLNKPP